MGDKKITLILLEKVNRELSKDAERRGLTRTEWLNIILYRYFFENIDRE